MSEGPSSPAPASPLENDDILGDILLRLPPLPASLPRSSVVCKLWRRLVSDPQFLRRFRAHHRTPPLLGFFYKDIGVEPVFVPTLEPPNLIPCARFSLPESNRPWIFLGCRHGLAAFLDLSCMEAVVWEPVTGRRIHIPFPSEVNFFHDHYIFNGTVLSAAGHNGDGYADGDPSLSPFKLILLFNKEELACACVYESESRRWGSITSIAAPARSNLVDSCVLDGNALFCFIGQGDGILEFKLDNQSLAIIQKPEDAHFPRSFPKLLRTEDRGLCFALISGHSMQLWARKANSNDTVKWVLHKTVELDQLLQVRPSQESMPTRILGFDDDFNVIYLHIAGNIFTIQLDSMLFEKLKVDCRIVKYYPFRSFYDAGLSIGAGNDKPEMSYKT